MAEPSRKNEPPKTWLPLKPVQETASRVEDQTAAPGTPTGAAADEEVLAFLAPAQSKDEMGRLAHYRVLKELGRGGMGCVLLAEDTKLKRKVALKVMLPKFALDRNAHDRFLREARLAAQIRHENVVTIHEVDEDRNVPFIALEYLQGMPLDKYLKEKGLLPLTTAVRIVKEAAEGLQAAHQQGLIHRDVKPGNIWLEMPKGRIKILDFGLARAEQDDTHLTQSGVIVGTPAFMAPEQARGETVDARSDLFSLGVVLYRLCTGKQPFIRPTTVAMLTAIAIDHPPPARSLNPQIPESLERIIHRLLEKDPASRYVSAKELIVALIGVQKELGKSSGSGLKASATYADSDIPRPATARATPEIAASSATRELGVPRWLTRRNGMIAAGVLLVLLVVGNIGKSLRRTSVRPIPSLDATNAANVQDAWADKLKLPKEKANDLGINFALIPPAAGVLEPFYLGKYEVTQAEWSKLMGYNPSSFRVGGAAADKVVDLDTQLLPVEQVSWFDCVEFCNKLSQREGLSPYYQLAVRKRNGLQIDAADVTVLGGTGYRMPTDAEWEHACRAGTQTAYHFGDRESELPAYAWFKENSGGRPHAVGGLKPNAFGLYDMHGNVREWTEDMLINNDTKAAERVFRGGYWINSAENCATPVRFRSGPEHRYHDIGLRLAFTPAIDGN